MLPAAHLSHTTAGRARIRIPSKRGETGYFLSLKQQLSICPGVNELVANSQTGSMLITHTVSMGEIAEYAERHGLFQLDSGSANRSFPVIVEISDSFKTLDKGVNKLSGGGIDIASLAFLGLISMAIAQMRKGHILPPGITLLWYALSILLMGQRR